MINNNLIKNIDKKYLHLKHGLRTSIRNINAYSYRQNLLIRLGFVFILLFLISFLIDDISNRNNIFLSNTAMGESLILEESQENIPPPPVDMVQNQGNNNSSENKDQTNDYTVQAVLSTKKKVVIASGINAKITKFKLESGDRFKKGDVLIEYDCSIDQGRLKEAMSRQRVTSQQLAAYQKLSGLGSASNMELIMARENNEQNKAMISQIKGRLKSCRHVAPWNGRIMRKMASQYEYVQTGRVLTEIASDDPLRAEFLIPSRWLKWLNINTPVNIYIGETDRTYSAKIINIFGEVDPVSQSIQIVAEVEKYHEDLLPGMSGSASFTNTTITQGENNGFLGLKLLENKGK